MKEHPIIFSTDMVKALLDGRKTMTRRVIKPQPHRYWTEFMPVIEQSSWATDLWNFYNPNNFDDCGDRRCPYGQVSDRLWVRETIGYGGDGRLYYRADYDGDSKPLNPVAPGWKDIDRWTPSIHMFRKDSRITLEITELQAERLQEITEADAMAEGFGDYKIGQEYQKATGNYPVFALGVFLWYWDSLNAKRGYGWATNPWVWVISFKKVEQ